MEARRRLILLSVALGRLAAWLSCKGPRKPPDAHRCYAVYSGALSPRDHKSWTRRR
jgi:hypothetical protein